MSFKSIEDIIKYAIEKEAEAVKFYTDAGKQEKYSAARKTFESFADEEKKHKVMLENLDPKNVAGFKPAGIADLKRSDYMVDIAYKAGMSYPDILRLAMKREEKAKKFYDDCAGRVDAGGHKKLFQMLSQEEAKHKLALETLYDNIMAKGGD